MLIHIGDMAQLANPGQFVNLYCQGGSKLLPRPISICGVDRDKKELRLVYAVSGAGTKEFSMMKANERIDVLGPLGKGFDLSKPNVHILIAGGGVGTPPLLMLAKELKEKYGANIRITTVLGFRNESYLADEFKAYGDVYITTDSGQEGFKGNLVEWMESESKGILKTVDYTYACGPRPMLKSLQSYLQEHNMLGEFSLEERMGCGFGGCVGCVVGIRTSNGDNPSEEEVEYKKVCKDGPVFDCREVIYQ